MTTPTTMTSMITTATTMMTAVVVAPDAVIMVIVPTVGEEVGISAVDRKHTLYHFTYRRTGFNCENRIIANCEFF